MRQFTIATLLRVVSASAVFSAAIAAKGSWGIFYFAYAIVLLLILSRLMPNTFRQIVPKNNITIPELVVCLVIIVTLHALLLPALQFSRS